MTLLELLQYPCFGVPTYLNMKNEYWRHLFCVCLHGERITHCYTTRAKRSLFYQHQSLSELVYNSYKRKFRVKEESPSDYAALSQHFVSERTLILAYVLQMQDVACLEFLQRGLTWPPAKMFLDSTSRVNSSLSQGLTYCRFIPIATVVEPGSQNNMWLLLMLYMRWVQTIQFYDIARAMRHCSS